MGKLFQDSGSTPEARHAEAHRILFEMGVGSAVGKFEREKDNKFVQDMIGKFEQYGSRAMVSAAQLFYLRDLKDRL